MKTLTPQVPEAIELPRWINPEALPYADRLEPIRCEVAEIEAGLIEAGETIIRLLDRAFIAEEAAPLAAKPCTLDEDVDPPDDVLRAVHAATGTDVVNDLVVWLTGIAGPGSAPLAGAREHLGETYGRLAIWTDQQREASEELLAPFAV